MSWRHTEETKAKLREATKQQFSSGMPPTTRAKISESLKGRKLSAEHKERIAAAHRGKQCPPHIVEMLRSFGGSKPSSEARARMSASKKGIQPQGAARWWRDASPETKRDVLKPAHEAAKLVWRNCPETSIEKAVKLVLEVLSVPYIQNYRIGFYFADFFLPERGIVLECDGDYWHSRPQQIAHDKKRDRYINSRGYTVLRIPEHEIKSDAQASVLRRIA